MNYDKGAATYDGGVVMPEARSKEEMIEHLFANSIVDDETGCILWQGCVAGKGYGVTCWQSKQVYVHRLAYHFEFPNETLDVIRHTCDVPNCWRLDHLVNGTAQENVDDKVAKGRHIFGSANYNTKFNEIDIINIRNSNLGITELAWEYGVCRETIWYILARRTWKHVP